MTAASMVHRATRDDLSNTRIDHLELKMCVKLSKRELRNDVNVRPTDSKRRSTEESSSLLLVMYNYNMSRRCAILTAVLRDGY